MTAVQINAATAEDAPLVSSILRTAFAEYESLYTPEAFAATVLTEELVRRLINQRWPQDRVSAGLLELIRLPLMLDLFWRTFMEGHETGTPWADVKRELGLDEPDL